MTVKELKALLQHYHDDNPVLIGCHDTEKICTDIIGVEDLNSFPILLVGARTLVLEPQDMESFLNSKFQVN